MNLESCSTFFFFLFFKWSDVHVSPPLNIVNNMVVEVGLLKTFTAINVLSIATPGTGAYVDPLKESVKLMVHGQEKT